MVDDINDEISKMCPVPAINDRNPNLYPQEFLNTLTMSGLPQHELKLKIRQIGRHKGQTVLISREPTNPSGNTHSFNFTPVQFPIKVAFAMTIYKSQGQTLPHVVLYLLEP
eukprot:Awhi_evm1s4939